MYDNSILLMVLIRYKVGIIHTMVMTSAPDDGRWCPSTLSNHSLPQPEPSSGERINGQMEWLNSSLEGLVEG